MVYKTIVENAPIAIIYLDKEGKIVVWNRAAEALLGYKSEAVVGKSIDLIIPERFREAHNAGYAKAVSQGKSKFEGAIPMKAKALKSDGTKIIISVRMSMIRNNDNTITGVLAFAEKLPD